MSHNLVRAMGIAAVMLWSGSAFAETWTLNSDNSHLAFGSVKKDTVGEVHSFEDLSGSVGADGSVSVQIGLDSVETYIDIRNERINEHVFGGVTLATLSAQIDMDAMKAMDVGGMSVMDIEGTLAFLGRDIDIETEMFVTRLSEKQVIVTTNNMLFLSVEDLGVNDGVDMLMKLAKLPGITRTVPVTVRMVFDRDDQKADLAPAQ